MIASFAVPGDIETRTGGYGYARRLLADIGAEGVELQHIALPGSFPTPDRHDLDETFELLRGARAPLLIDGLALGVLPADRLADLGKPVVALCHHPLALETGLSPERAETLRAAETAALDTCAGVITTSQTTAGELVRDFAVPEDRITVAPPGTDPAPRAHGSGEETVMLVSVGALVPRKGFNDLIAALAELRALPWHLTIAGSPDRDPTHADSLRQTASEHGLERRIEFTGEMQAEALGRLYRGADLFVLASRHEGFGMVFTEALAHGLPVVGCDAGAVAEATATGGAQLVPPGDRVALCDALGHLISDGEARAMLAEAAWTGASELPRWSGTAQAVAEALRKAVR